MMRAAFCWLLGKVSSLQRDVDAGACGDVDAGACCIAGAGARAGDSCIAEAGEISRVVAQGDSDSRQQN